jgi:hypothetical protein
MEGAGSERLRGADRGAVDIWASRRIEAGRPVWVTGATERIRGELREAKRTS